MMAELILASEPPIVNDAALRVALIQWFRMHADSWKRQADGCLVYGAEEAADKARARASVCEQFAHELEQVNR